MVAEDPPDPPRRRLATVPRDIELICLKCLEKRPADRYPSAAALADDLRRFAAGEPVSVRPAGLVERGYKWARRKPTVAALYAAALAGAVLVAVAVTIGLFWREAVAERARAEQALDRETASLQRFIDLREGFAKRRVDLDVARAEYGLTIQLAYQELRDNNAAAALALLDGTRPNFRGWEWRYVHALGRGQPPGMEVQTGRVNSVAWSPDGSRFLTSGPDGAARGWDARTGAEVFTLRGHTAAVLAAAFSPDGSRVVTASADRTARVWDAATGVEVAVLKGHASAVLTAVFHTDGAGVATVAEDGEVGVWGTTGAREWSGEWNGRLAPGGQAGIARSAELGPDCASVVTVWDDGTARVFRDIGTFVAGHWQERLVVRGVRLATLGRDGEMILTVASGGRAEFRQPEVDEKLPKLLRAAGLGEIDIEPTVLQGPRPTPADSAVFSPDGCRVAAGCSDGTVRVWDVERATEVLALKGHAGPVRSVAWSPDGERIVTAADDGTVRVWDATPTDPHSLPPSAVAPPPREAGR